MRYLTDESSVAHERLDDEVIVINLSTGAYFSLRDAAADCWTLLVSGHDTDEVAAAVAARYGTSEPVADHVAGFVNELVGEGLLQAAERAPAESADLPPHRPRAAYAPPVLEKYEDMEELLLLDPIHEVDEAGWPNVAAEST